MAVWDENESLLPEQLLDVLAETTGDRPEVDVHVERQGTGPPVR